MHTHTPTQTHTWAGILLVLATGLMHGVEGPAHSHEAASKGLLFFLNAAGALVAARGIARGATLWSCALSPQTNQELLLWGAQHAREFSW
jgi:hypothetical protein